MTHGPHWRPKRLARLKTCPSGKVAYVSAHRAEVALLIMLTNRRGLVKTPESLNTYPCARCGKWHIGNRPADWLPTPVTDTV